MGELTKEDQMELRLQLDIKDGAKKAIYGFLAFIIGVIITWITFTSSSSYYIILWGAILFGFIYMIIGIHRYSTSKYKYNKLMRDRNGSVMDGYDSSLKKQEIQKMIGEPNVFSKKVKILLIVIFCIVGIVIAGIFTGVINFDSAIYDEDFRLTGDGTIPTDDTMIQYMSYQVETQGYVTLNIDLSVDDGKKVDIYCHEDMVINPFGLSGDHIENVSSYSGIYKTRSNGHQTVYVEIWNSNNYEEVTGHIKIS